MSSRIVNKYMFRFNGDTYIVARTADNNFAMVEESRWQSEYQAYLAGNSPKFFIAHDDICWVTEARNFIADAIAGVITPFYSAGHKEDIPAKKVESKICSCPDENFRFGPGGVIGCKCGSMK